MENTDIDDIAPHLIAAVSAVGSGDFETQDPHGRAITKAVRVVWEGMTGWMMAVQGASHVRHLAVHPRVSLTYVHGGGNTLRFECIATKVKDAAEKKRVWDLHVATPAPLGYDPSTMYRGATDHAYSLVKLMPDRVVMTPANGEPLIWPASSPAAASKGQLVVDAEELGVALETQIWGMQYVLDIETGEVIAAPADDSDFDMPPALEALIEANLGTRFIVITPLHSHDGWVIMNDFVQQLPEGDAAQRLARVINGKSPFRRFKDELLNLGSLREKWFAFHDEALFEHSKAWLETAGIEATLKRRHARP